MTDAQRAKWWAALGIVSSLAAGMLVLMLTVVVDELRDAGSERQHIRERILRLEYIADRERGP